MLFTTKKFTIISLLIFMWSHVLIHILNSSTKQITVMWYTLILESTTKIDEEGTHKRIGAVMCVKVGNIMV